MATRLVSRGFSNLLALGAVALSTSLWAYEDEVLTTDDASVQRIAIGDDFVYVFTNSAAGAQTATLRTPVTLARYLVVGGGGAGGWTIGGGGGGGGCAHAEPAIDLSANAVFSFTVGAGGDAYSYMPASECLNGGNGGVTTLSFGSTTVTSLGGGGGASYAKQNPTGGTLACGGGCAVWGNKPTPAGTTYEFFPGGTSKNDCSSGGGGVCSAGGNGANGRGGKGGRGFTSDITGESLDYGAGGGGGAGASNNYCATPGAAGGEGAGAGSNGKVRGSSGLAGRGGGGGGGGNYSPAGGGISGGDGGCGSVILRVTPKAVFADRVRTRGRWHTNGKTTFNVQIPAFSEGAVTVKLRWGADAENLTEETVSVVSPSADGRSITKSMTGIAEGNTVYWQFVMEHALGESTLSTATTMYSLNTRFVPADVASPVYTISVAAGQTVDLTDWMQNNGVSSISGSGTIVKTGAGTLTVTTDALKDFTGDVYVLTGGKIVTKAANPLGTTAGKVCVEDGACLQPYSGWIFGEKPVYGEGWGVGGNNSFILGTATADFDNFLPTKVFLTGDGRVRLTDGWRHTVSSPTYDLGGFTLYISGGSGYDSVSFTFANPGHVVLENTVMCGGNTWGGGAVNTLTIKPGVGLRGHWWSSGKIWSLIMKPKSILYASNGDNWWHGPVTLEGPVTLQRQFVGARWSLFGRVSGPGSIGTSNNTSRAGIALLGNDNSFTGGVYLNENPLLLKGSGSLPRDGAALTNYNSSVEFDASPKELPEGYFYGTGIVTHVIAGGELLGAWKNRLVKDGVGELIYCGGIGSERLEVRGGSFYIRQVKENWPCFTNVQVKASGSVRFSEAATWEIGNIVSGGGVIDGTVSATGFVVEETSLPNETLTISGSLSFAEGAEVEVPAKLPHRGARVRTLVTAAAISGVPKSTNKFWDSRVVTNGDGSQSLQLISTKGFAVILQ